MVTKVREHRGTLDESMETMFDVVDFDQLVRAVQRTLERYGQTVTAEMVHVEPYGWDGRIGWNTHVVLVDGYGVWGMTNGPLGRV
jgi:hypothetical protein